MSDLKKTGVQLVADGARAFEADMGRASSAVQGFGKAADSLDMSGMNKSLASLNLNQVGQTLTDGISRPLAGVASESLDTAATFEETLSGIQAVLNPTSDDMDNLRNEAIRLGSSTKFSAQESALAIEMLAKNGLSAQEILSGALEASLSFAAATGADLATSANIATDAMQTFGKQASDLPGVVDQLVGVTVNSKFSWQDLALALSQGGGVFAGVGGELEDFTAILAGTPALFNSGSDAGTSLKTMMTRLVPSSKEAEKAMRELGIITADGRNQFFTATGQLRSMAEVSGVLAKATEGLSDKQRSAYLTTIFGEDAIRAAIATAKLGTEGFLAMQSSIAQVDAGQQAATRMDNFKGSVDALQSAVETLQISIGSRLLPTLRQVVESVTDGVNWFTSLPAPIQNTTIAFGAAVAAAGPLLLTLGLVSAAITAIPVAVATLAPVAPVFAGLAAAGATLAAAWAADFGGIRAKFNEWAPEIQGTWQSFLTTLSADWRGALGNINTALDKHGVELDDVFTTAEKVADSAWKAINRTTGDAAAVIGGSIQSITGLLAGEWDDAQDGAERVAKGVWSQISMRIEIAWKAIEPILKTFGMDIGKLNVIIETLRDGAGHALDGLSATVRSAFGDMSNESTSLGRIIATLQDTWSTATTTITNVVTPMWDIVTEIFQVGRDFLYRNSGEIATFLAENFGTIGEIGVTTFEIISEAVQIAFELIDATVVPALTAIAEFIERNQNDIKRFFDGTWTIISALITGTLETIELALQGTLAIMQGDWETAFTSFSGIVDVQASTISSAIDGLGNIAVGGIQLAGDGIITTWQITWDGAWGVVDAFFNRFANWSPNTEPMRRAGDSLVNGLREGFERTWGAIPSFFGNHLGWNGIATEIGNYTGEWAESADRLVRDGILNGMDRSWGGMWDFISSRLGWDGLARTISDYAGDWASAGDDLVRGIKDGMQRTWGEVEEWIRDEAGDLPDWAKDALGISSPSEVMADTTGEPIAEGIGVGFLRGFAPVEQEMSASMVRLAESMMQTSEVGKMFGQDMGQMVPHIQQDVAVLRALDEQLDQTQERMLLLRDAAQMFGVEIQGLSMQLQQLPTQAGEVRMQLEALQVQAQVAAQAAMQTVNNYNLSVSSNAPMENQQAEFNALASLNR